MRYYKPEIGRFVSEDTYEGQIHEPLSLNRYTYVYNNPLIYIDPSGHIPTVMEAARMAEDIYKATLKKDKGVDLINGWKLADIKGNKEGLKLGTYSRKKSNGTLEYALVNKGTTPTNKGDWVNNL
ncbi:RHS repeat-associated core domain-containing protein [Paenibacillus sp. GCM10027629]|uniref:RHS repeat-associated core domain-containing protein n=1 Tax=Paenibacillus sp. GCM10027629 TaxID=3273414 RepID=UPI0036D2DAC1